MLGYLKLGKYKNIKSRRKSCPERQAQGRTHSRWCVVFLPPLSSVPQGVCFPEQALSGNVSFDLVLMHTGSVLLCHRRVLRRAVPVAVESPGIGFTPCAPELTVGPELLVTWQGQRVQSYVVLRGPLCSVPMWGVSLAQRLEAGGATGPCITLLGPRQVCIYRLGGRGGRV